MNNSIECIASAISKADNIMIITHIRPDGDTVGSAYGLKHTLDSMGKSCAVLSDSVFPSRYDIITNGEETTTCLFKPEFIITVDVAGPSRLGKFAEIYDDNIDVVIDHHISTQNFGKLNYIDAKSASTAEIIFKLCKELCKYGAVISEKCAEAIYAGVSSDTGCFKFSNVTASTFETAAELMKHGADCFKINSAFFEKKTLGYIELEKLCLQALQIHENGLAVILPISLEMVKMSGADEYDVSGMIDVIRGIEGVKVSSVVREEIGKKSVRVSVRTYGNTDAVKICAAFGGGGHVKAAGCDIEGTLTEAVAKLLEVIKKTV